MILGNKGRSTEKIIFRLSKFILKVFVKVHKLRTACQNVNAHAVFGVKPRLNR